MPNENYTSISCEPVEDLFPETMSKEELLIEYGKVLALKAIIRKSKYLNDDIVRTILGVEYEGEE